MLRTSWFGTTDSRYLGILVNSFTDLVAGNMDHGITDSWCGIADLRYYGFLVWYHRPDRCLMVWCCGPPVLVLRTHSITNSWIGITDLELPPGLAIRTSLLASGLVLQTSCPLCSEQHSFLLCLLSSLFMFMIVPLVLFTFIIICISLCPQPRFCTRSMLFMFVSSCTFYGNVLDICHVALRTEYRAMY